MIEVNRKNERDKLKSVCQRCAKCWYYKRGQCKGLLHYGRPDCLKWYEENLYVTTYQGVKVRTFFKKDKRKQKKKGEEG